MSLDTLLTQLGLQRPAPNPLEAQLHAMRRDVRRIGRALSQQTSHATEDWADHLGEVGRDAARHASHMAEIASLQARRGADQFRRDPLPVLAVIGTGLLLASLLRRK